MVTDLLREIAQVCKKTENAEHAYEYKMAIATISRMVDSVLFHADNPHAYKEKKDEN